MRIVLIVLLLCVAILAIPELRRALIGRQRLREWRQVFWWAFFAYFLFSVAFTWVKYTS